MPGSACDLKVWAAKLDGLALRKFAADPAPIVPAPYRFSVPGKRCPRTRVTSRFQLVICHTHQ